jgi:predicted NBD/HSP70 family sugar kinase
MNTLSKKPATLPAYFQRRMNMENLLASRRVLRLVYEQGPLTQAEAAHALELSQGACNLHFQRLEYEGLVYGQRLQPKGRGRPRFRWELSRAQNATIGLVFDPPHLFVQLEDFAGQKALTLETNLKACHNHTEVAEKVSASVARAIAVAQERNLMVREVYAALPGVLDTLTGAVRRAVNFPALDGLDVQELLQTQFKLSVHANSLGVAYYYGEAAEIPPHQTALVIYWDLGLGLVFGRNRQILTVQGGDARGRMLSELGHISINADGPRCRCGQRGCLEAYTGGWVLLQRFAKFGVQTLEDLAQLAATDKPGVDAAIQEITCLLGLHLACALQMFGVTVVRVTGPLAPVFARGKAAFVAGLAEVIGAERAANLQVAVSNDVSDRLLRGATRAARHAFIYPDEFARLARVSSTLQGQHLAAG